VKHGLRDTHTRAQTQARTTWLLNA